MDEVTTTARRRRVRTFAVATAALLGLAVAAPIGADASPDTEPPFHGCFPVNFNSDDGPVTDLIHHNERVAEPLLPGSANQLHNLNCTLSSQERALVQILADPSGLTGSIVHAINCLPNALNGQPCDS